MGTCDAEALAFFLRLPEERQEEILDLMRGLVGEENPKRLGI